MNERIIKKWRGRIEGCEERVYIWINRNKKEDENVLFCDGSVCDWGIRYMEN